MDEARGRNMSKYDNWSKSVLEISEDRIVAGCRGFAGFSMQRWIQTLRMIGREAKNLVRWISGAA